MPLEQQQKQHKISNNEIIALFLEKFEAKHHPFVINLFEYNNFKLTNSEKLYRDIGYDKNAFKNKFIKFLVKDIHLNALQSHERFNQILKYDANERAKFRSMIKDSLIPRDGKLKPLVFYISGVAGTGKTEMCWNQMASIDTYWTPDNVKWFYNYLQQPLCVFNDLRLTNLKTTSLTYFFNLIDCYPVPVEIKGGHVQFNSPLIMITTIFKKDILMENYNYSQEQHTLATEENEQLYRRIDVEIFTRKNKPPIIKIINPQITTCIINDKNQIVVNGLTFEELADEYANGKWRFKNDATRQKR